MGAKLAITVLVISSGYLFNAVRAHAATFNFQVSGGCSEACSATAAITPGSGVLDVVLTDTQANPRSAGDLLSSIEISPTGSLGTPTLSSQSGQLINVTSNTGPYSTSTGPPTHWGVGTSGGQIVLETAGPFAVGGEPTNMIIGPPDASGNYSNGNASVADGHFSPYINGTASFVLTDADITTATMIRGVTFDFGTGPDTFLPATPIGVTPLPAALPLFASGLGALGLLLAWRRKRKSRVSLLGAP